MWRSWLWTTVTRRSIKRSSLPVVFRRYPGRIQSGTVHGKVTRLPPFARLLSRLEKHADDTHAILIMYINYELTMNVRCRYELPLNNRVWASSSKAWVVVLWSRAGPLTERRMPPGAHLRRVVDISRRTHQPQYCPIKSVNGSKWTRRTIECKDYLLLPYGASPIKCAGLLSFKWTSDKGQHTRANNLSHKKELAKLSNFSVA